MGTRTGELSYARLRKVLETFQPELPEPKTPWRLPDVVAAAPIGAGQLVGVGTDGSVHPARPGEQVLGVTCGAASPGGLVEIVVGHDFAGIEIQTEMAEIQSFGNSMNRKVPGRTVTVVEFQDGNSQELMRGNPNERTG